ncbi:MAG: DUF167 domain-containing protein [bacterium]|nr:DUF167 domain-containing protein [bacterium]
MRIFVSAKPKSKNEKVEKTDDSHFTVWVKEPPEGGKANRAVAKALGGFLGVGVSGLALVSGHGGRQKVFELLK